MPPVLGRQGLDRDAAHRAEGLRARRGSRSRSCTWTPASTSSVLAYRDRWIEKLGLQLIVASVQDAIERGLVREEPNGSRNRIQTPVLLEAAEKNGFDALFGGGRRDEEKARAKERVFSFRDEFGQWDPKNQRPELWSLYNGRVHAGPEHPRLPALELDRARHLDLHRGGADRDPGPLPRRRARGRRAGRDALRRQRLHAAPRRRDAAAAHGPLPDGRRREPDRGGRVGRRHPREDRRGDRGRPRHRAWRHPRRRPGSARPRWKTARRRATSDADATCCGSRRPGSVDDGKSTLIGRLLYDSKSLFSDQLRRSSRSAATAATTTPTWRC